VTWHFCHVNKISDVANYHVIKLVMWLFCHITNISDVAKLPHHLNPKTQNPKTLNHKTLNTKTIKPLNPTTITLNPSITTTIYICKIYQQFQKFVSSFNKHTIYKMCHSYELINYNTNNTQVIYKLNKKNSKKLQSGQFFMLVHFR
jgi:hypothetical protein